MNKIVSLLILCLLLCSCNNKIETEDNLITCDSAMNLISNENAILIDVRTEEEYTEDHLNNAINLNYETISDTIIDEVPDKDTYIIVYCRSGSRSSIAASTLKSLGYTNVYDLGAMSNCN